MTTTQPDPIQNLANFMQALSLGLPDLRDKRGQRHNQVFILAAVVIAMLCQCRTVSSFCRFIRNRLAWLRRLTRCHEARAVSRAHLPRMLDQVDWPALSSLVARYFDDFTPPGEWLAVDGKVLRGSGHSGERQAVVIAVAHRTGAEVAWAPQAGLKTSEVPVVRQLLQGCELVKRSVSFDALHCNPTTLAQVAQAGGTFLVQVKENQSELLNICRTRALCEPALAFRSDVEKSHGRLTERTAHLVALRRGSLDSRWQGASIRYLVVVLRDTFHVKTGLNTTESSYYISNAAGSASHAQQLAELANAIRGHWRVEANNWVRDVTLGEDLVRVKAPNQAHVMALLRSLVLKLLRKTGEGSFQVALETLAQVPGKLVRLLRSTKFL